jgi:hypothetical protein
MTGAMKGRLDRALFRFGGGVVREMYFGHAPFYALQGKTLSIFFTYPIFGIPAGYRSVTYSRVGDFFLLLFHDLDFIKHRYTI